MWNPELGDGRAIILGEIFSPSGQRFDFQLKGAGDTPYSGMGDGRAPLGAILREYIVSEAMAALSIPTTRSLAVVSTGERVARQKLLPSGILTRLSKCLIRIGTFEYCSRLESPSKLKALADYTIQRLYPHLIKSHNPYIELLQETIEQQARLIAKWQAIGFVHGVMNTDNILLSGETVDYGPCAFLDDYQPNAVFSSIDKHGRYAYNNQPLIAQWNLSCLASSLLPLLDQKKLSALVIAEEYVNAFDEIYNKYYALEMAKKIGFTIANDDSSKLIEDLLKTMQEQKLDYTRTFRTLSYSLNTDTPKLCENHEPTPLTKWIQHWREKLWQNNITMTTALNTMQAVNPIYIPRNHLLDEALAAMTLGNLQPCHELIDCLSSPFEHHRQHSKYALPPNNKNKVVKTFCGT